MLSGVQPMACGGCGKGKFRAYCPQEGPEASILLECLACTSVSVIQPAKPALVIEWGPNATGRLTRGKPGDLP